MFDFFPWLVSRALTCAHVNQNGEKKMQPDLLTIPEFCHAVNLGKTSVYKLINQGKITALKLGKKTLVPRSSVEDFVASLPRYKQEGKAS